MIRIGFGGCSSIVSYTGTLLRLRPQTLLSMLYSDATSRCPTLNPKPYNIAAFSFRRV